jgi:hypothetical protein
MKNRFRCNNCGRFLKAEYTSECDFDFDRARKAGFDVDVTNIGSVTTSHPDLAQFLYCLDAGECLFCEDFNIHFDGPRYYFAAVAGKFPIEEYP